jgi:geranylgeranyl pyrophosphate synthase
MDRLTADPNVYLNNCIQDWLIQSWFAKEPVSLYREALIYVILSLWPKIEEPVEKKGTPSYFPLPSLCCQSLGKQTTKIIEVNAAWILLYMASYLLDKVEDHELGHALITRFGDGVVANLTTGLIFHAERILAELEPDPEVNLATIDAIRRAFHQMGLEVCNGQHLDLVIREPSLVDAWKIIDSKSGKFFALGSYLGARMATENPARIELMSQIGRRLGILVQLANDLAGLEKDEDCGSDLALGKRTLPVIYALQVLQENERNRLVDLLTAGVKDKTAEIEARKAILSSGAIVYLSLEADKHRQQAKSLFSQMEMDSESARPLMSLLEHAFNTRENYRKFGEGHR